jgi:hypothetical protein
VEELVNALYECKILDPACGSGAFPMGILQKLVHILQKADPDNKNWEKVQKEKAEIELQRALDIDDKKDRENRLMEISNAFDVTKNTPDYARKLYLIENCIYGVDIQPIATQISKLRFFISLVVDQKNNTNDENFGIIPLPNLETKFVTANTLIGINRPTGQLSLSNTDEIKKLQEELRVCRHKIFSAKTKKTKQKWRVLDKEKRLAIANELKVNGWNNTDADNLAGWDPYNQNASSPFFDPEWMFGLQRENGGLNSADGAGFFDVVLGNPPYIQIKWLKDKALYKQEKWKTFSNNGDIYCLFYEKANILLANKGVGCFITSNKWLRSNYGKKLRDFFVQEADPIILIDLGADVFENATVDTNILIWKKDHYKFPTYVSKSLTKNNTSMQFKKGEIWSFSDEIHQKIKEKADKIKTRLPDFKVKLNYGILTGANKTFLLNKNTADYLISLDEKNRDLIKPILRGQDIFRYYAEFDNKYLLNIHNGVKSKAIPAINLNEYPTIIKYLETFGNEFKTRGEQGDNWYNLRNCAYIMDYEKPKILYSDIVQERGKFYYDENNFYTNDTAFMIIGEHLKYLVAILNSSIFSFLYKHFYSGGGLGEKGLRFKKEFLLTTPIPNADSFQEQNIVSLVNQILEAKQADPQADTSALEAQIDQLVYELYGLTQEEIDIIEGN